MIRSFYAGLLGRRELLAWGAAALGLITSARTRAHPLVPGNPLSDTAAFRWGIDYGSATDPALARQCRVLVLEPGHARPIAPLRGTDSVLLGYISLGEVEKGRPYFADLDHRGALGKANANWPDARMADLRHPAWRETVLDIVIPSILALGYDGIFIDTMDNAEFMEQQDPIGNKGMAAAGAAMVLAIRQRYPAIRIMLNRGYAVLPFVADAIDYVLGETMASRWNFDRSTYEMLSASDWEWQASRLRAAKAENPHLLAMTLDYWDPADTSHVAALYAQERKAGFIPYVSVLALDRLLPEPAG